MNLEKHVVRATLDEVARLTETLKKSMPTHLSEQDGYSVELGVAEALTNIVLHGYASGKVGSITLIWEEHPAGLRISILDEGLPIPEDVLMKTAENPFNFDPDDIESLPESGRGLALMHVIFDAISYERHGGMNCLSLEKEFQN